MMDNPCRYCKPPERRPGCHDTCKQRADWLADTAPKLEEARQRRAAVCGVYQERTRDVVRAYRRRGRK